MPKARDRVPPAKAGLELFQHHFAKSGHGDGLLMTRRNLKGAPCGVGFRCLPQPLQKGTPFMTSNIKYIGMDVHKEHADFAIMPTLD